MPKIAIIGTGFGGLGAAIELLKDPANEVELLEKSDGVGGVWRENTYPGAACDVPSPYYSFSYELNPRWPRRFSEQPDILAYLQRVAEKYALLGRTKFGHEVLSARFREDVGQWEVVARSEGKEVTSRYDVVISAVGQLSRPKWPEIAGRESFAGQSFHSALWDHSVDLTGKRVAVIGTGASAIQFVPRIQPQVGHLTVFQRTAPYLVPRFDTAFGDRHHKVFERLPATQLAERGAWFGVTEGLALAFLYNKPLNKGVQALTKWHMTRQLKGTDLLDRLWPDYPVGCKRILFSNDYLPALRQDNVTVETNRIDSITPNGVVTSDGVEHPCDVIIYGTGFKATEFLAPIEVTGLGQAQLQQRWAEGAKAYLGVSVPDFPNFFVMYGPNTNLGSGSIIFMLECQARYIAKVVASAKQSPLVVREDVAEEFDAEMQQRLADGVWSQCASWYRLPSGRVVNNWPGTVSEYRRRTRDFDASRYQSV